MATRPEPEAKFEHALAGNSLGVIEYVARQTLAACPGEGPEGRRQADLGQLFLGTVPEVMRFVGEMERDFGHMRRPHQRRVGADEACGTL